MDGDETRLVNVENKVSASADSDTDDFILRGCNVHVQNAAAGSTLDGNSKGNLVIGYNEVEGGTMVVRLANLVECTKRVRTI
jgi:hypothetical protein